MDEGPRWKHRECDAGGREWVSNDGSLLSCARGGQQLDQDARVGMVRETQADYHNSMHQLQGCVCRAPSGVRVNAVEPGIIYSDSGFANYGNAADTLVPELLKSLPSRRLGTVQETSSAVVWLLSRGAAYVSGVILNVSGGGQLTHKPMRELPLSSKMPVYGDLPEFAKL